MTTFEAHIMTPEGSIFDGEVSGVRVPGVQGSFEVKFNHASLVSTIEVGRVVIRQPNSKDSIYAVSGGFVEVHDNKLTLLAEAAEAVEDIDVERAEESRKRALKRLGDKNMNQKRARQSLERAENRLRLARKTQAA